MKVRARVEPSSITSHLGSWIPLGQIPAKSGIQRFFLDPSPWIPFEGSQPSETLCVEDHIEQMVHFAIACV